jgi:hypothetical protein
MTTQRGMVRRLFKLRNCLPPLPPSLSREREREREREGGGKGGREGGRGGRERERYIYIYIYIYRERERERGGGGTVPVGLVHPNPPTPPPLQTHARAGLRHVAERGKGREMEEPAARGEDVERAWGCGVQRKASCQRFT